MIRDVLKAALHTIVKLTYRVRLQGDLPALAGQERALLVANHESWLDGVILALFVPGEPVFVVNTGIARKPVFKLALRLVEHLAVDTANPLAMKRVVELLKSGRRVVIFPEGRLTTTGALMKVYDGPAFAALRGEADLIPVGLTGPGWSRFTRLGGQPPRQWFPQITLTVQAPTAIRVPEGLPARERRRLAGEALRGIMQELAFARAPLTTLFNGFLQAARLYGRQRPIMTDVRQLTDESQPDYRYDDLLKMSCGLGRLLLKFTQPGECVGLLMPNMAATLGLLLGASAHGRLPAMLNYKAGVQGLLDACTAAAIQTVVTSRAFIAKGNLEAESHALEQAGLRLVYLEDLRQQFTARDKLAVVLDMCRPDRVQVPTDIEAPAVVLFTSGSEGKPKGVVLSHRAIMANIAQVRAVFDFNTEDRALNALPIFHSFGLTGGTLLPLMCGIHLLLYASPLHFRIIPELAYDRNITVLFGTNTFLANYGLHANPYDFFRLRYVIAGAEKLTESVRLQWFEKFGKRILEGYGATETAPVLAVNTPKAYRVGTVGQFLPAIEYQLVPVPGIEGAGALHVKGPNLMSGYLRYESPGVLEPTASELGAGWYATGDIVRVEDGFVTIVDRLKRFAKIGGEMISLAVVEQLAERAGPGQHAVTTTAHPSKGEALVLFTTSRTLTREALSQAAQAMGLNELAVPRRLEVVDALPLLGTGKTDYVALKQMAGL